MFLLKITVLCEIACEIKLWYERRYPSGYLKKTALSDLVKNWSYSGKEENGTES
jgi:hypothetical protein